MIKKWYLFYFAGLLLFASGCKAPGKKEEKKASQHFNHHVR